MGHVPSRQDAYTGHRTPHPLSGSSLFETIGQLMPSKTPKQAKFMAACSHGAGYKSCPPAKVSKEFNQADKGTGIFKKGKKK